MADFKGKNTTPIIVPSASRRAYPLHLPHFPPPVTSDGAALETYPMSSPTNKRYDEELLAHAPEVTKAELQDGYNPDILMPQRPSTTRVLAADSDSDPHDVESAGAALQPKEKLYNEKPKSFWKTRKGIIIASIVVLIVVILAAVLGGVLGSRKHGNNQEGTDTSQNSGTSTSGTGPDTSQVQGGGPSPSGSPVSDGSVPSGGDGSSAVAGSSATSGVASAASGIIPSGGTSTSPQGRRGRRR